MKIYQNCSDSSTYLVEKKDMFYSYQNKALKFIGRCEQHEQMIAGHRLVHTPHAALLYNVLMLLP